MISTGAPMPVISAADATAASASDRVGPGTRFAQFELLDYVGGGGMGRVFRAYDTALARHVAIKILPREQTQDAEILLRFRNEAQTAARLNHPNLVQVYHIGEADGLPYIVFELIEGVNIRTLVEQKGVLPLDEAIGYTVQVAKALAHAAAHGVVHRDIKPSNVLITAERQAKLIDLGLARLQRLDEGAGDLTASGVTLGTFDYIAPEQARDPRTADVRSDIYSLGCTLFFMLTGRPPFAEGTVLQKLLQHQGQEPPDVRQFRPELPAEVSRLLRKMMAKDPRHRYQTPQQLLEALTTLAERLGLEAADGVLKRARWAEPASFPWLRTQLPWLVPVGALLVTVGLLAWLWSPAPMEPLTQGLSEPEPLPPSPAATGSSVSNPPDLRSTEPAGTSAAGPGTSPTASRVASGAGDDGKAEELDLESEARRTGRGTIGGDSAAADARLRDAQAPAESVDSQTQPLQNSPPSATPAPATTASEPGLKGFLPQLVPGPGGSGSSGLSGVVGPAALPAARATPTPQAAASGVIAVDPNGSIPNSFRSLAAACTAAAQGDVIELRFNGPHEEPPLALRNLKLTIRAAEGFQPVILFQPGELAPVPYPKAMLSLVGGQLTLLHVGLELDVPRDASSDQWSLFEIRQTETIRLEKCTFTVRNAAEGNGAYHPDVAFFRIKAGPKTGPGDTAGAVRQPVTITLADCVLRGEAVVLRVQDLWPIRFTYENGLVVTTEPLLEADGGERTPWPNERIELDLQHLTAVIRGGLCRLNRSGSMPRLLPTQVSCANSILLGGPTASLIEQIEVAGLETGGEALAWNGDRNFYEGFESFWTIRPAGVGAPPVRVLSFDQWREHWGPQRENMPQWNRVQWRQLPSADRPAHAHIPADYALSPPSASPNPALGAASDGGNVGAAMDRLPAPPASVPTPRATAPASSPESRNPPPGPKAGDLPAP